MDSGTTTTTTICGSTAILTMPSRYYTCPACEKPIEANYAVNLPGKCYHVGCSLNAIGHLGEDTVSIMECSNCKCRAFVIESYKHNQSHVRRGKRTTRYQCVSCGQSHDSVADNLEEIDWKEIPYEQVTMLDHVIGNYGWIRWQDLDKLIRRFSKLRESNEARLKRLEDRFKDYLNE